MELTKEERHQIYKGGLKNMKYYIKKGIRVGMCHSVERSMKELGFYTFDYDTMLLSLPELLKYKTERESCYWFPLNEEGNKKRIEVLTKCIEETK